MPDLPRHASRSVILAEKLLDPQYSLKSRFF